MHLVPAKEIEGKTCEEIDVIGENPQSLFTLGYELGRFAFENEGVGIAAPQVGIFRRIMVFMDNDDHMMIAINPRYFPRGSRTKIVEGCLSYPDEMYAMKRYKSIRAHFFTFNENKKLIAQNRILSGQASLHFQHETDHLNGITIAMHGKFYGKITRDEETGEPTEVSSVVTDDKPVKLTLPPDTEGSGSSIITSSIPSS